jgi:1-acyl-sn-glycerol-3-phosphate acyltransferase
MQAWPGETEQVLVRPKGLQWLRVVLRACAILLSIFALILPMYALRRLGFRRQSQQLVRLACRGCLWAAGLKLSVEGEPMHRAGAIVSNHVSWLDIFVLNAVHRVFFVAKSEVRNWPIIGLVARAVGTVFVRRSALDAASQVDTILERINQGDRLLFFPEGTSTDGQRVLPFKSTLFAAFFDDDLKDALWVQPVTLNYRAPEGRDPRFYAWWGDTGFAEHLVAILAHTETGAVKAVFHPPMKVSDFPDRKVLAKRTEELVRSGLSVQDRRSI